jgi:hypothetical protein
VEGEQVEQVMERIRLLVQVQEEVTGMIRQLRETVGSVDGAAGNARMGEHGPV